MRKYVLEKQFIFCSPVQLFPFWLCLCIIQKAPAQRKKRLNTVPYFTVFGQTISIYRHRKTVYGNIRDRIQAIFTQCRFSELSILWIYFLSFYSNINPFCIANSRYNELFYYFPMRFVIQRVYCSLPSKHKSLERRRLEVTTTPRRLKNRSSRRAILLKYLWLF